MRLFAIATFAATLMTGGDVALAQVATDMPDNSIFVDVPVMQSTPVESASSRPMFSDTSLTNAMASYPANENPMNKDEYSKKGIASTSESEN